MENFENGVVDNAIDAVSGSACPITKALPVVVPVVLLIGGALLIRKVWKGRLAKKAAAKAAQEQNPE